MKINIEKEFTPYELAVKLKELGFDERCLAGFRSYGDNMVLMSKIKDNTYPRIETVGFGKYCHQNKHVIKAPLLQQVLDWFLNVHHLYAIIIPTITMNWTFKTITVVQDLIEVPPYSHVDANDYSTYEEARLECLKKLIEIVENEED